MNEREMVDCPVCQGYGRMRQEELLADRPQWIYCQGCRGSGVVPLETAVPGGTRPAETAGSRFVALETAVPGGPGPAETAGSSFGALETAVPGGPARQGADPASPRLRRAGTATGKKVEG